MRKLIFLFLVWLPALCRAIDQLDEAVAAWRTGVDLPLAEWASDVEANRFRKSFVQAIEIDWGPPVGFKAALTNPIAQERFGLSAPILGTLLRGMILTNGSTITAHARQLIELDLLVVVRDASFNKAHSEIDFIRSISHVAPFIELADGIFPPERKANALNLIAYNAGARSGVRGALHSLPVDPEAALALLPGICATLIGPNGINLANGSASALLGDPIRVVRWLRDAAQREGYRFVGGEMLSLGSIAAPVPVREPGDYEAVYEGFPPGTASVRVTLIAPD